MNQRAVYRPLHSHGCYDATIIAMREDGRAILDVHTYGGGTLRLSDVAIGDAPGQCRIINDADPAQAQAS